MCVNPILLHSCDPWGYCHKILKLFNVPPDPRIVEVVVVRVALLLFVAADVPLVEGVAVAPPLALRSAEKIIMGQGSGQHLNTLESGLPFWYASFPHLLVVKMALIPAAARMTNMDPRKICPGREWVSSAMSRSRVAAMWRGGEGIIKMENENSQVQYDRILGNSVMHTQQNCFSTHIN